MMDKFIHKTKLITFFFILNALLYIWSSFLDQLYGVSQRLFESDGNQISTELLRRTQKLPSEYIVTGVLIVCTIIVVIIATSILCNRCELYKKCSVFIKIKTFYIVSYVVVFVSSNKVASNYDSFGITGIDLSFWNQILSFIVFAIGFIGIRKITNEQQNKIESVFHKHWISFIFLSLFITFMIFGRMIFMPSADLAWDLSIRNFSIFWFSWFLTSVLIVEAILLLDLISRKITPKNINEKSAGKTLLCVFIVDLSILSVYFCSMFPGVITEDAICALDEISITHNYTNAFPATIKIIYDLIIPDFITPFQSAAIIILVQVFLYLFTAICFSKYAYEKRVRPRIILLVNAIVTVLPNVGLFIMMFGSNYYFVLGLTWMTFLLAKIVLDRKSDFKTIAALTISIVFIFISRSEAVTTVLVSEILLMVIGIIFHNKKYFIPVIISVFLIFFIRYPMYQYMNVDVLHKGANSVYSISSDLVAATYYYHGKLSDEANRMAQGYGDIEEYVEAYREDQLDTEGTPIGRLSSSKDSIYILKDAVKNGNIDILMRARFNKSDVVWDVTEPVGYHTGRMSTYIADNTYGIHRNNSILFTLIAKIYYPITVLFPFMDILLYRGGIWLILSLIVSYYLWIKKNRLDIILFIPIWTHVFTLMGCLEWSLCRHVLAINYSIIILIIMMLINYNVCKNTEIV